MIRAFASACVVVVSLVAAPLAAAQPGGGAFGPRMSDEDAKAAWTTQARAVASLLHIEGDALTRIVDVYTKARRAHAEDQQKLFEEMRGGGMGGGGFAQMREKFAALNEKHADALDEALAGVLTPEQLERTRGTLGSFNRIWDMMAHTIAGFGLEDASALKAQQAVVRFVANTSDADALDETRDALEKALGAAGLKSEQIAQVLRFTRLGGRGGAGGRGGPRG